MEVSAPSINLEYKKFNYKKNTPTFGRGLTKDFISYTNRINVKDIEYYLARDGIRANLRGNKAIAACIAKTVKIFKAYHLPLPKSVELKSFGKNRKAIARCLNPLGEIEINSDEIGFKNIEEIDKFAESRQNHYGNTHFLTPFIDAFARSAHFQNMLKTAHGSQSAMTSMIEFNKMSMRRFILWGFDHKKISRKNLNNYIAEVVTKKITGNLSDKSRFFDQPRINFEMSNKSPIEQNLPQSIASTNCAIWNGNVQYVKQHGFGLSPIGLSDIRAYINTATDIIKIINNKINDLFKFKHN